MKVLRWFALLLVFAILMFAGAVVGLYHQDALRDQLLLRALQPYGVKSIRTRINAVDSNGISLARLEVDYADQATAVTAIFTELSLKKLPGMTSWLAAQSWAATVTQAQASLRQTAHGESDQPLQLDPADFLPQSILKMNPLGSIRAEQIIFNYTPLDTEPWFYSGSFSADPLAITSDFKLIHGTQHFIGDVNLTPKQVAVTIGQEGEPSWVSVQSSLEFVEQNFVAGGVFSVTDLRNMEDWLALLPVDLPATRDWQGHFNGAYSMTLAKSTLDAWLAEQTRKVDGLAFNGQVKGEFVTQLLRSPLQSVDFKGSATIQFQDNKLLLKPLALGRLQVELDAQHEIVKSLARPLVGEKPKLLVHSKGDIMLTTDLDFNQVEVAFAEARLALGNSPVGLFSSINLKQTKLSFSDKQLALAKGSAKFDLDLADKPNVKGIAKLTGNKIKERFLGNLQVTLEDLTQFRVDYDYYQNKKLVEFDLTSERANLATATFNQWAEKMSLPVALELGDFAINMQGKIDLNKVGGVQAKGNVLVDNWQGQIEKNYFEALDSPFQFSGDLSEFVISATVTNGLFDIGLPITNIRYQTTITGDTKADRYQVQVKNLQSELVGGLVRIPEIVWDSETQQTEFNVIIYDWQFAEMIELLGRDDLQVSGVLDGMLPIKLTEQGITIKDGLLAARKPGGYIRFKPDPVLKASLSDQQELKIAIDVLENFMYDQLDVVLNQDTDFNQVLALTLKGKNPKAYGGTPVNLNLSVEHNIEPLIQTLTLPSLIEENWENLDAIEQMNEDN